MSKGRPSSSEEIKLLEKEWATNPHRSRRAIHREFERHHGKGIIGLRKAQALIPTFPTGSAEDPGEPRVPVERFPYKEWRPWRKATSETNAFLLTMDAVCQTVQARPLYDHEARWGMRLRVALEGLMPYDQFCFVAIYAQREVIAFHLNEPKVDTVDLDAILAYKPWRPESAHAYGVLAWKNVVPKPLPGSLTELSDEDAAHNLIAGKAWKTLRVDLRPPWYMNEEDFKKYPFIEYLLNLPASRREEAQEKTHFTEPEWEWRARETALQFWMGDDPIFEKPQLHGMFGLIEPFKPDVEVQQDLNTDEETKS